MKDPHILDRSRFSPVFDHTNLRRRQRKNAERRRQHAALRTGLLFALATVTQVAVIVVVAAQHEAWPW